MLSSSASVDDEELIDELDLKTNLDRGQCKGLIAALTREFAFIQGPLGTGKSNVGVSIMKVLLACAPEAEGGPGTVV
jgi:hypothetical protein